MTQFNAPSPRRPGGDIDVYTGLIFAAFLVLAAGIFLVATGNIKHSASNATANDGGMLKIVTKK